MPEATTTTASTAASDVVNIWSERHSYVPDGGALGGPDRSLRFDYVDVGPGQRCYQVIAYNGAGDGADGGGAAPLSSTRPMSVERARP